MAPNFKFYGLLIIILNISILVLPTLGDEILLKNGDRLTGRLQEFKNGYCVYLTQYSNVSNIEINTIDYLSTDEPVNMELISGEKLSGRIILELEKVQIQHTIFGNLSIPFSGIAAINRPQSSTTIGSMNQLDQSVLSQIRGMGTSLTTTSPKNRQMIDANATQPIGQKPEDQDDINKLFLRQTSVLLRPGEAEMEFGFSYKRKLDEIFGIMRYTERELLVPVSLRYGLFQGGEAFVSIPFGYAHREIDYMGDIQRSDLSGIGDTSAGIRYQILKETNNHPEIIASLAFCAPSGCGPYKDPNNITLGSGHWSITPGIQFVKTFDPVVIFGGIDYTYSFARQGLGQEIQPGAAFGYNIGMGFAINQDISVSTQLLGSIKTETRLDGKWVGGSSREPVGMRMALTTRWSKKLYVEPSATFGLNTDHPDFILGTGFVYRF
jgi:hypothetical protein